MENEPKSTPQELRDKSNEVIAQMKEIREASDEKIQELQETNSAIRSENKISKLGGSDEEGE
ncbi:MAG TPA: hypothetical protein VL576_02310 [Candidatus Paceibacterota bacterium]|jgi:hypothetical protein|nr:hypothetical protein [Candidatus Paceibacterota bacterium]